MKRRAKSIFMISKTFGTKETRYFTVKNAPKGARAQRLKNAPVIFFPRGSTNFMISEINRAEKARTPPDFYIFGRKEQLPPLAEAARWLWGGWLCVAGWMAGWLDGCVAG